MASILHFAGGTPRTVTQKEILHERILRSRARKALRRWRRHRKEILDRIVAGAVVEDGPFAVGLDIQIR